MTLAYSFYPNISYSVVVIVFILNREINSNQRNTGNRDHLSDKASLRHFSLSLIKFKYESCLKLKRIPFLIRKMIFARSFYPNFMYQVPYLGF